MKERKKRERGLADGLKVDRRWPAGLGGWRGPATVGPPSGGGVKVVVVVW